MDSLLIILIVVLPLIAQASITSTYNKYSKKTSISSLTGMEVARKILNYNGLESIDIKETSGTLTDYYDPKNKVVVLSSDIYNGKSISSVSVAAHECGHAIQDKERFGLLVFRSTLVPVVNFTSKFATIFLIIGLALGALKLYYIGIILLCGGLLFQLVTLPVEFNASNRAKVQLSNLNIITENELNGTKKVLSAAAFTYVASFLATLLQIFRLVLGTRRK